MLLRFITVVAMLCAVVGAQVETATINTASVHPILVPDAPDYTFGAVMDPDGVHAYVTVSGALSFGPIATHNNRLLKIDTLTHSIVDTTFVGFYPEDIKLHTDANGQTDRIYVGNSWDGTVTVLDGAMNTLTVIAFGECFPTIGHFPFQMVFSPDQSRLYVGTLGCGVVFVVDTDDQSPDYHSAQELVNYNGLHGSVNIHSDYPNLLLAGSSVEFGGFAGTFSTLDLIDLSVDPPVITVIPLGPQVNGDFASISDLVPASNGRVFAIENSQVAARVFEIDLANPTAFKTHNLQAAIAGLAFLHQGAFDADERVLVITSLINEVVFFDVASENPVGYLVEGPGVPQPSDVVFTSQGEIMLTYQNAEMIRFYGDLPRALILEVGGTAQVGQVVTLSCANGVPFDAEALLYSAAGGGPLVFAGLRVFMNTPIFLLDFAFNDAVGQSVYAVTIPNDPAFGNVDVWIQAFTAQPVFRLSNPHKITIQP